MERRELLICSSLALLGSPVLAASRQEVTDVVVVGSGGTGLTAALSALAAGQRVLVLEKMPITGGNTQLAAGGMNAAETRPQAARKIADSWKTMFDDTMKGGQNRNNPELVEILARQSSGSIDWLLAQGADMNGIGRMAGASVDRTHRPVAGDAVGHNIVHALRQQAIKQRLDIRIGCQVLKILQAPNGRVTGVLARNKYGELFSVQASAVVLAAGGFSANLARVAAYRPAYAGFSSTNQPGATGDGMDLGAAVGGELIDMDQIQIHPTQAAGSKILITEAVRGNGAILVNREGKRFVNELTTRDAASAAVLKQPGGSAFLIFDTALRKSLKQIEGYYHLELVREGATPAALAAAISVDAKALEQTLDTYNGFQAARNDAEFKRPDMPRALKTGPFVALEIRPGIHYTMGGLRIDARTRVLRADRTPIAGLFAGGEVAGGVHGANRLGGNSISETITFGRIAAAQASAYVKEMRQLKLA